MNLDPTDRADPGMPLSPHATQQLLHDLQTHQIELELQNEELHRTQVALDAERARYFDLYDLAPVGYCTVSEAGLILEANLTAATLLGVSRVNLIKKAFSRFIANTDQDVYYLHRKKLFDCGQTQSCELRMVKPDGTSFWAHLEASSAQIAGGARLHRVVLANISDRKNMDQALQEKNLELESARHMADKANRAKSEFLSSMSHELRSPLNSILGFAQLLESGSPEPTLGQKGKINHILQAGWYLLELINEILDLSMVESGKLSLSMESLPLADVLRDCQNMIRPLADQNGIQLSFAPVESHCFVHADQTRLTQLMVNLLSNAVKYNRPGGTVEVTFRPVEGRRLRICVRDSGKGLSADDLANLFQPFNRLGQEATSIEGTGIGLVVCKRLVGMMQGSIGVESTLGVGSMFWIELNLAAAAQLPTVADEVLAPQVPHRPAGEPRTVLYIEDDLANRELVEELVARRPDLHLLSAQDGVQGIALARSTQPDVILTDIHLRGISGFEVRRILLEDPLTKHIPMLAISANAMPGDIEEGLAAGFFSYLTKPFKVGALMQALDLAIARSPSAGAKIEDALIEK
jgi:PAS domain S-box-containing protein